MKKLVLALLLSLGLVACNTTATTIETEVQTAATILCGFEPTIASIAAIITVAYGGAATEAMVNTIATNICKCSKRVIRPTPADWSMGLSRYKRRDPR